MIESHWKKKWGRPVGRSLRHDEKCKKRSKKKLWFHLYGDFYMVYLKYMDMCFKSDQTINSCYLEEEE